MGSTLLEVRCGVNPLGRVLQMEFLKMGERGLRRAVSARTHSDAHGWDTGFGMYLEGIE